MGLSPRVRCLSRLWRTASLPWPGVEGRPWSPPEKGWTSPRGREVWGTLKGIVTRQTHAHPLDARRPNLPTQDRTDGCGTHLVCFFEQYNIFMDHSIL